MSSAQREAFARVAALRGALDSIQEQLDQAVVDAQAVGVTSRALARVLGVSHQTIVNRRNRALARQEQEAAPCRS